MSNIAIAIEKITLLIEYQNLFLILGASIIFSLAVLYIILSAEEKAISIKLGMGSESYNLAVIQKINLTLFLLHYIIASSGFNQNFVTI